ncbi:hypothetical protein BZM27_08885 [Paraburkholderia steynii]|uniref:Nucleoside phosphorylase domain-containing protein n=1 Tax=Paraburkholderia steynii TaxID=1245441 RepID=A0A4R0XF06_9BURK|nr:hypothetical protein BZM27_08885 [Paraburkholderia steynii]
MARASKRCTRRALICSTCLNEAIARGCAGIISFGTAGGLAPDLAPGTLNVASSVHSPLGVVETDLRWAGRIATALCAAPAGVEAAARADRGRDRAAGRRCRQGGTARLRQAALAVDMESHLAGAIAEANGLPFVVCRAIVDPAWRTLPSAATAGLRDDARTAIGPILRELARQPSQLGGLLQVAADARAARASLVAARQMLERSGALLSI